MSPDSLSSEPLDQLRAGPGRSPGLCRLSPGPLRCAERLLHRVPDNVGGPC